MCRQDVFVLRLASFGRTLRFRWLCFWRSSHVSLTNQIWSGFSHLWRRTILGRSFYFMRLGTPFINRHFQIVRLPSAAFGLSLNWHLLTYWKVRRCCSLMWCWAPWGHLDHHDHSDPGRWSELEKRNYFWDLLKWVSKDRDPFKTPCNMQSKKYSFKIKFWSSHSFAFQSRANCPASIPSILFQR